MIRRIMEVITTHINADFDAFASMLAAKKLYPDAVLAFPGAQEKSIRDFLVQSTMYFLDIHKTSRIPFDKIEKLILVDIRQAGRIGKFSSVCNKKGVEIHIYDHHPSSPDDITGSLEDIRPYGSTTSIMCDLIKARGIELTPDEATVLMLGIYEDTGSLTFSSTMVEDYNAAAYLLSQGANLNIVSDMIVKELTVEQISLLNELIENSSIHTIHGIDVMIAKAFSVTYVGDIAVLVHKLKNMENLNVLFALVNMDGRIYVVGRSRISEVNAGEVLLELGGGGHATAASATMRDITLIQAEQLLLSELKKSINPVKVVKDFMTTPVKSISDDESLEMASELLTRYNINVLAVINKNRLTGLISRQIIEKAKYHGLQMACVREYMTSEYSTVKPETPLNDVKKYIIENNQRFLPVLDNKVLVGAITRTDLLRVLHVDMEDIEIENTKRISGHKKKTMKRLLSERLSPHINKLLKDIGKTAGRLGYNAYAVGGFVRDIYLNIKNFDIDIVIEGDGIRFAQIFAAEYGCGVKIYRKFGTAVLNLNDNLKIDVASARLEYYEKPAALPKVEWSSIKLDLYRRDFIINTLCIRLNPGFYGEVIDFFGARRDIKEKILRVLHNLSFVEDPSRIFRAVRFEQRFNFHLSKLTKNLIENSIKFDFPNNLSGKRIYSEMIILLKEEDVLQIMKRLDDLNLLKYIHASIEYNIQHSNLLKNIKDISLWYELLYLDNKCEKWFVFFLGLIEKLTLDEAEEIIKKFDIKKKYAASIRIAKTTGRDILYKMAEKRPLENHEIYQYLHNIPIEVCLYLMAKTTRQDTKKAFSLYYTQLHNAGIHVTGKDLKKLGIPPGKIFKKIMKELLKAVLNGEIKGKKEEISFVKNRYITA